MSTKKKVLVLKEAKSLNKEIKALLAKSTYDLEFIGSKDSERLFWLDKYPLAVLILQISERSKKNLDFVAKVKTFKPHFPIIAVSSSSSPHLVFEAIRAGVVEFLVQPLQAEQLEASLDRALEESAYLKSFSIDFARYGDRYVMVFGPNKRMLQLKSLIEKVADTDVPVLITGETGTGKELVARTLHWKSLRRNQPFVKVNAAALPPELLESELFGYEKGAFTGAYRRSPGRFELAQGGVLLIDEIAEIAPNLQAKLLHFLQDGQFSRVGGEELITVDTRVIATTNRDLETEVEKANFRNDLYYRLNVINIHLLPLRERKEDIPDLVSFFLQKYCRKYNKKSPRLTSKAMHLMLRHDWPGNVRELENLIKKIIVYGDETLPLSELGRRARIGEKGYRNSKTPSKSSLKEISKKAAQDAEKKLILQVLRNNQWNRRRAAQTLQISYRALLYKIKQMGLDKKT